MEGKNNLEILAIFSPHMKEEKRDSLKSQIDFNEPEFTLDMLLNRTPIKYKLIANPEKNPNGNIYQGKQFHVLEYSDNSILLTEIWGTQDENHINFYFYNGHQMFFAREVFDTETLQEIK